MHYEVEYRNIGEICAFNTYEGNSFLDALEEALYVAWELEPVDRDWRIQLANECYCYFAYARTERVRVSYGWDNSGKVLVEDI